MTRNIRPLTESDIADLQRIDDTAHGSNWSHRTYVDDIECADRLHLVAERNDDTLIGHAAAWIDNGSCRITNVAVDPSSTGHGHATALLLELIDESLTRHRVMNLQLEVRPSNRRAQKLYGRFGFQPVGVDRNFYDHDDDHGSRDALVMAVADVCSDSWRERLDKIKLDAARRDDAERRDAANTQESAA